jgi:hypothetical protein
MDRILNVEFPPLYLEDDEIAAAGEWKIVSTLETDYTPLPNVNKQFWFSEMKLDLSGYTRDDLTVYFRNSFEQSGTATSLQWQVDNPNNPLRGFEAVILETTILSSVPMSEDNLIATIFGGPGFTQAPLVAEFGNFNRTHIIHGTNIWWGIDTTLASDALNANGQALGRVIQSQDFSSLEPTASENIYCYRIIYMPKAYNRNDEVGLHYVVIPAKRVILNCMIDKEADLEYMMRLKRSYELANQV